MVLLLDTNTFIWSVSNVSKLGSRAERDIANPNNRVYVSEASLLECAIKQKNGKLEVEIDFSKIDEALVAANIEQMPFDAWAAQHFVDMPKLHWADPFDAAIMAQAISKHLTLVTSDYNILASNLPGLKTLDAQK